MKKRQGLIIATVLVTAAIARAQPQPGDPAQPGGDAGGSDAQIGSDGSATPVPPPIDPPLTGGDLGPDPYAPQPGIPELPKRKALPRGPIGMPEVLTTPTGWLLPAAVLYSRT